MLQMPIDKVLIPTALSMEQDWLQDYAIGLCKQLGAELLFFAVIDSPTTLKLIESHPSAGSRRDAGFRAKLVADAKVVLRGLVERAAAEGVRASGHAIVAEQVGQEVIREAAESEADLILLAAEDHSILWGFLFGDSSEVIQHLAPCPVLTVKSPNAKR